MYRRPSPRRKAALHRNPLPGYLIIATIIFVVLYLHWCLVNYSRDFSPETGDVFDGVPAADGAAAMGRANDLQRMTAAARSRLLTQSHKASGDAGGTGVGHNLRLSREDADVFACHFFQRLPLLGGRSSLWELQQPAAWTVVRLLYRMHPQQRCAAVLLTSFATSSKPSAMGGRDPTAHSSLDPANNEHGAGAQDGEDGGGEGAGEDYAGTDLLTTMGKVRAARDIELFAPGATENQAAIDIANATDALTSLSAAVKMLQRLACGRGVRTPASSVWGANVTGNASSTSSAQPGQYDSLPAGGFAAVRRLTIAVLQQLWEEPGNAWQQPLVVAAPAILHAFLAAQRCGAAQRPAMEFVHVSKSGGTSICQLARLGTRRAQHFDQDGNCLQEQFADEPKWTRVPDFAPRSVGGQAADAMTPRGRQPLTCHIWAAYDCPSWLATPEVSCAHRAMVLNQTGLDFYSNEHALHGGTAYPGASHTCPQFESLLLMRDPLARVESHIMHITSSYVTFGKRCSWDAAQRAHYALPRNLSFWSTFAPAVINNYYVRSLLGRHFHCKPFGAITRRHLHHAQLKLMSFDHVAMLQHDELSNVIFRLGLGWPETLQHSHVRFNLANTRDSGGGLELVWKGLGALEAAGFPKGTVAQLQDSNALDVQLFHWAQIVMKLDSSFLATSAVYDNRTRHTGPTTADPSSVPWHSQRNGLDSVFGSKSRSSAPAAVQRPNSSPGPNDAPAASGTKVAEHAAAAGRQYSSSSIAGRQQLAQALYRRGASRFSSGLGRGVVMQGRGATTTSPPTGPLQLLVDPQLLLFNASRLLHSPDGVDETSQEGKVSGRRDVRRKQQGKGVAAERVQGREGMQLEFVCLDASLNGTRKVQELPGKKNRSRTAGAPAPVMQPAPAIVAKPSL